MEFDIGILGGGQLARMSIQAAQRMGLRCLSLDPGVDTPASQIAPAIQGALDDLGKVAEIFHRCERVTLENEFISAEVIRAVGEFGRLVPALESLATIQDKLLQRQAFARAGVPSPQAWPIAANPPSACGAQPSPRGIAPIPQPPSPPGEHSSPPGEGGFPIVLKARFGGYDGKGTRYARTAAEFESFRELWAGGGWLAEEFVPFTRELAAMVYISEREKGCFPVMETVQTDHVCDLVFPAFPHEWRSGAQNSSRLAREVAIAAVESVGGSGLYGVEMFELENGEILVNELAPRPHNTGHYSLDWGGVSQFDQHVRLVLGLPTVEPEGRETCMANLLGQVGAGDFREGLRAAIQGDPGVRVHWYGKAESRPGRKMGHLNVVGSECVIRAEAARRRFYAAWTGHDRWPIEA